MDEIEALINIEDRTTTRKWDLDLALAGKVYSPKKRPTKRQRQRITQFLGRDGTVERFAIQQTVPYRGHEAFSPPTQAQYSAVERFYVECCETRNQAATLLSARDYAENISKDFSFNASRRNLIWISTASFILYDKNIRSLIRTWNISHRDKSPMFSSGAYLICYKRVFKFANNLVDDMRAAGSEIFG